MFEVISVFKYQICNLNAINPNYTCKLKFKTGTILKVKFH